MCGIIAVLQRRSGSELPDAATILSDLDRAVDLLTGAGLDPATRPPLDEAGSLLATIDRRLRGPLGTRLLIADPVIGAEIATRVEQVDAVADRLAAELDATSAALSASDLESLSAALVLVRDGAWQLGRDRIGTAAAVADLAGGASGAAALDAYWAIQVALSAIDRLEVRGRDSAGVHITVHDHGLDLDSPGVAGLVADRRGGIRFGHRSVEVAGSSLSFVYKAAAEIGELGDNVAVMRQAIRSDALLRRALAADTAEVTVLGHTRWASVGIISEANAHPLNQIELGDERRPYVVAALNGDVDNYADLKAAHRLEIPGEITTDAKVIPTLIARDAHRGVAATEAFRRAIASFEGSVAIGADVAGERDRLHLALLGSGQGLYVGFAPDGFVVASEPYGVVEIADRYLRLDGDTPADPDRPESRGQIVVIDRVGAGSIAGIERMAVDGTPLPVSEREIVEAGITTRDIDRGDAPHFLLKELHEAPASFRTTLRGRIVETAGGPVVALDDTIVPPDVREGLASGRIRRVQVIGQGTAAVAGQAAARIMSTVCAETPLAIEAVPATELSGFGLRADMSDTLIVAVSQSGTTTDTNRTVDLARSRGARVIAIVNRRRSDLTDRADGVLYTSDGRDIEMSVASTKAFYSQVSAGALLAFAFADAVGVDLSAHASLLTGLRQIPDALVEVLARRESVAIAARRAPQRRHWAVVGNGANRVAANEVRIKLSELCYKAIPSDATEDKKHIDLSSEPLILVCAAGLYGSTADDVAKEVAIFRAHKAFPIVVATEGEARFVAAAELVTVPAVHPELDFILSSMVGHLFGYEAALAIDASARPLRELRSEIEHLVDEGVDGQNVLERLTPAVERYGGQFLDGLRAHHYDGQMEASTAVRVATIVRYAAGLLPMDTYELDTGRVGSPATIVEDLTSALTTAIDELTRPIDAIKHQAKTVTVGISRSDEVFLQTELAAAVVESGAPRDRLGYATLRTLVGLAPAVAEVTGWTRYRIEGDPRSDAARLEVIDRGGIARDIPSRTAKDPTLRGTKRRAAEERSVWVALGGSDGRSVVTVPMVKGNQATELVLLHVKFHDRLAAADMRSVLQSFKDRYGALRDAVMEVEPTFRDDLLGEIDVIDLLTRPVYELAGHWTGR